MEHRTYEFRSDLSPLITLMAKGPVRRGDRCRLDVVPLRTWMLTKPGVNVKRLVDVRCSPLGTSRRIRSRHHLGLVWLVAFPSATLTAPRADGMRRWPPFALSGQLLGQQKRDESESGTRGPRCKVDRTL